MLGCNKILSGCEGYILRFSRSYTTLFLIGAFPPPNERTPYRTIYRKVPRYIYPYVYVAAIIMLLEESNNDSGFT